MVKKLISVGLDVGTTTTQLVISHLWIENKASLFSVPEMHISQRQIAYQSPIYFTPLIGENLVDGKKIREIVQQEYASAGLDRANIDTGAIIITGETSRKENAKAVVEALAEHAGDFVVATAGPHLESVLAAKGAGADVYSEQSGKTVLHMDIGGGTTNLALIAAGKIIATGCLNVGGRLLKFQKDGTIGYCSPVFRDIANLPINAKIPLAQLEKYCDTLSGVLEMAAGLRPATELLTVFSTTEAGNPWLPPNKVDVISFSGGVAACIKTEHSPFAFGDIGPILGRSINNSALCKMPILLSDDAIRATVIGAGSHATQLSGSTVFYQNICLPLKNIPVVSSISALSDLDGSGILALSTPNPIHYNQIAALADKIAAQWPAQPILIATEADMAKALGHALALRTAPQRSILCIDRVKLTDDSFLDVGNPMDCAIPVVIKTLILNTQRRHI